MDQKRWVDIGLAFAGVIVAFLFAQIFDAVWSYFEWPVYADYGVGLPVLLGVFVGAVVFLSLRLSKGVTVFLTEVVYELSKVTWPQRKETMISSVVVLVMVAIASVIVFLFDGLWGTVSERFLTL